MSVSSDGVLLAVAESIADGRPVDWDAIESQVSEEERAVVRQLRIVSELAHLHRTLPLPPDHPVTRVPTRRQPDPPAIGRWGPLLLVERLGGGASGDVYRAWDRDLERDVALKLLRSEDPDADLLTSRITAEGRLLARMRHPNVVTVHGVASHDGRVGLWMDLIQGVTLEEFIATRGPMGAGDAARVGIELCHALGAIHAAGLLHRDIKTQNVMREEGGRIVLMDLGTGRELTPESANVPRDVAGTPLYIAPEIFRGEPASVRTDLYSVGVLLYRLVTASFPVEATTIEELRAEHAAGHATTLREARPDLPPAFLRAVDRALSRDADDRHESARALETELACALEEADTKVSAAPRARGWRRAQWWWAGTIAALLLGLVGVRFWIASRAAMRPSTIQSLVVLPLANVSGDPAQDYFADGLTEELIGALGRLNGLNVISRTSAMRFKAAKMSLADIARTLHVDAALEGSVFVVRGGAGPAAPTRVRVAARLIQAGTDVQIWNDTFEAALGDVMALQSRIARAIADRINLQVNSRPPYPLTGAARDEARGQDPVIVDLYLRGRSEWNKRTEDSLKRSILYFQEAIDRDPQFARAYAGLADAYTMLAVYTHVPRSEAIASAEAAANNALRLDQSLAEVHASLGYVSLLRWEWDVAERQFQRAIALKPEYTATYQWYADLLSRLRRLTEAHALVNKALTLDPFSTSLNAEAGALLIFDRRYDEAVAQLEKTMQLSPAFTKTYVALAEAYGNKHDFARALTVGEKAPTGDPVTDGTIGYVLATAGRRRDAQRLASDLERRYSAGEYNAASAAAVVCVGLAETDQALMWLERGLERRESWITYIAVDPRFDTLRSNPRFVKLLAAAGLPR